MFTLPQNAASLIGQSIFYSGYTMQQWVGLLKMHVAIEGGAQDKVLTLIQRYGGGYAFATEDASDNLYYVRHIPHGGYGYMVLEEGDMGALISSITVKTLGVI